mgnify:CR=1 FL=1
MAKQSIRLSDHFTYGKLLRFTLPSICMMVFTSIYGVVDGLFVSNFVGKTPFAAVNLVMPFVMILGGMGFMIGTGGTALVSKLLGEGKQEEAHRTFSMLVLFTLLLGAVLSAVGILTMPAVSRLLGASDAMMADCILYGRIVTGFTFAFMLQNVFQSFFIAAEKPRLGLFVTVAAGVTNMVLDYGLSKTKSQGMRKSSDKIGLSTQLGYSTDNVWFYTLMGDLNTQFAKGYDYPDKEHQISNFFAPAYSNIALGMEWRPKSNYSLLLSPVSTKMTFVTDDYLSDLGAFGVDPGDHFKIEGGAFVKARAELPVMENVNLITTADFFTPYSKDFGNIDVNWDVLISMKINKVLSATINTTLKYDNDVKTFDDNGVKKGAKVQFKEVLGIGLAYNF